MDFAGRHFDIGNEFNWDIQRLAQKIGMHEVTDFELVRNDTPAPPKL